MLKLKKQIFFIVLAILIIAFQSTQIVSANSLQNKKNISQKIDIGSYGLYTYSIGKGKPTIIFESGYGCSYEDWNQVQSAISKDNKTLSYDRAGLGQSDASPLKRVTINEVHELHKLLENAKLKGPYIIVAHSLGGYNARLFAAEYPKEVAGIVFVDASHEEQEKKITPLLTPEYQKLSRSQFGVEGSYEDYMESTKMIAEHRDAIKNIPITVLTATDHQMGKEIEPVWLDLQNDLASMSNNSRHYIVDCGHYIQNEKPQVVIDAIKEMIKIVKNN